MGGGLYTENQTAKTYHRLAALAESVLQAGYPVVLDATFLQHEYRQLMRGVAERARVRFIIMDCQAPVEILRQRVSARSSAAEDASEATIGVLDAQLKSWQPLSEDEQIFALQVDTADEASVERVLLELEPECTGEL